MFILVLEIRSHVYYSTSGNYSTFLYVFHYETSKLDSLPITDGEGFIIASTGLLAGNHNDAYKLETAPIGGFQIPEKVGLWN